MSKVNKLLQQNRTCRLQKASANIKCEHANATKGVNCQGTLAPQDSKCSKVECYLRPQVGSAGVENEKASAELDATLTLSNVCTCQR